MMQFKESKAEHLVVPKPGSPFSVNSDYSSTVFTIAVFISVLSKAPILFFITVTAFISRAITADEGIDWGKASLPLAGYVHKDDYNISAQHSAIAGEVNIRHRGLSMDEDTVIS
ncbi:uncharacterized protein BXIN_2602 [Babesia sp. Xinjiang]|uniref:uncharacterized protein n=1 Tax=Babesia sp. Xinjiang TaxID=462227 RepID=UPI000A25CE73|nr:uncharacterized protein BXIN_2602 [Babesia sp. Xinjiang]ORM41586.1 hypothetical protein BXIN_2602 [Babesia sp. Xinjiang]